MDSARILKVLVPSLCGNKVKYFFCGSPSSEFVPSLTLFQSIDLGHAIPMQGVLC